MTVSFVIPYRKAIGNENCKNHKKCAIPCTSIPHTRSGCIPYRNNFKERSHPTSKQNVIARIIVFCEKLEID